MSSKRTSGELKWRAYSGFLNLLVASIIVPLSQLIIYLTLLFGTKSVHNFAYGFGEFYTTLISKGIDYKEIDEEIESGGSSYWLLLLFSKKRKKRQS